jgi:LacI family repressor for deo operon, udp, cdd, tsx, nupC, and nupG
VWLYNDGDSYVALLGVRAVRPTIYDVADRARVSIATVSRVLNGRAKVTEETRGRVMEAVATLGYRPSPVARGLAMRNTSVLALFHESFQTSYASQLISGAESEAAAHGYALLAYQIQGRDWEDLIRMPGRADGVIVTGSNANEAFLQSLASVSTPTALLGRARADLKMDGVLPDNAGGTTAAIEHLITHGRTLIAHIAGPLDSGNAPERLQAYRETLARHGQSAAEDYVQQGDYSFVGGAKAMRTLLALPRRPDAVFAANDLMAMGAMRAIEHAGLKVGEDIAVVGFDGLEAGEYMTPSLTTVFQPIEDIGREAVRLVLWRLANADADVREEVVPTRLVVRASCGEPHSEQDGE